MSNTVGQKVTLEKEISFEVGQCINFVSDTLGAFLVNEVCWRFGFSSEKEVDPILRIEIGLSSVLQT